MEVYISELDIETYRGIKNLKMENLAPINIITGDNNSGKTSVLELLQSVKNPTSFRVWRNLIRNNGMNLSRGLTYYDGFYDLFDVNEDTKKIEYAVSLNGEKHVIEMQATVLHEEILESQFNKLQGLSYVRYEDDYAENIMNISKLQIMDRLRLTVQFMRDRSDMSVITPMKTHQERKILFIYHQLVMPKAHCI